MTQPALPQQPQQPQLLLQGHADVFAVRRDGTGGAGARHHLFRLTAGAQLPLPLQSTSGYQLLAVPLPGACCLPLDEADISAAQRSAALQRLLQALAEAAGPAARAAIDAAPDLRAAQQALLALAQTRIEAEAAAHDRRLRLKAAATQTAMQQALAGLTQLDCDDAAAVAVDAEDPLLRACQRLGQAAGISLVAPARWQSAAPLDRLEEIARASRVRCRRVLLRGDWWRSDSGPLLGWLQTGPGDDDRQPVALLQDRGGRYAVHDPVSGQTRAVGPELAARIAPQALCFYRSLPAHSLGLKDLLRFAGRGLRPDVLRLLGAGAAVGLLGLVAPLVTGWLVDEAVPAAQKSGVLALAAALLAASGAALLLDLARVVALLRIEGRVEGSLQAAVWDRVLALPVSFFRRHAAGDLALRILAIRALRRGLSGPATDSVLTGLFALSHVALLFWLAPGLAWLALGLIVLGRLVSLVAGIVKLRIERQRAELAGQISGLVHEYLGAIVKLRLCAAEARAFANWAARYGRLRGLTARSMRVGVVEQTFLGGYPVMASAALFAAVGALAFSGQADALSTGGFIAFNAAFGAASTSLMELSTALLGLLRLVPEYERLRPILQAVPENTAAQTEPGQLSGEIEVQNLVHAYPDGPSVLDGVSFRIRPGEFVAVVGPSGSGKSTLMRLLMGFERPQAGSVCYDGLNLLDVDADALRRQLGVVLQAGQLMAGDLYSNIAGHSGATPEEVREAVRLCGLDDDIQALPMGLHTTIGEGSSTLSGGQRQRILIARAIVGRPRILLLDEATSALDNRSQQQVADSLARLSVTRVVIAHRLSTIVKADRILVLDQGRLVQQGGYEELLQQPGLFADLVRRQAAG